MRMEIEMKTNWIAIVTTASALSLVALAAIPLALARNVREDHATIKLSGDCGFAKSGRKAAVANAHSDKAVEATVHTKWEQGIEKGERDEVRNLAAGEQQELGCTKSENIPVIEYTYSIAGSRVKG